MRHALQEKLEEKLVGASTRRQQLQQERGSLSFKRRALHGDKLSRKLARYVGVDEMYNSLGLEVLLVAVGLRLWKA